MRSAVWPVLVVVAGLLLLAVAAVFYLSPFAAYGAFAAICGALVWLGSIGQRCSAHGVFASFVVAMIVLRLFTVQLVYNDDPTTAVIVKPSPGFATRSVAGTDENHRYVIGPDENSFFGETVYLPMVRHLWIAVPVAWLIAAWFWHRPRRRVA